MAVGVALPEVCEDPWDWGFGFDVPSDAVAVMDLTVSTPVGLVDPVIAVDSRVVGCGDFFTVLLLVPLDDFLKSPGFFDVVIVVVLPGSVLTGCRFANSEDDAPFSVLIGFFLGIALVATPPTSVFPLALPVDLVPKALVVTSSLAVFLFLGDDNHPVILSLVDVVVGEADVNFFLFGPLSSLSLHGCCCENSFLLRLGFFRKGCDSSLLSLSTGAWLSP